MDINCSTQQARHENKLLGKATLATSLGDFISFSAVLKLIEHLGYGPAYSGYSVAIKAIGISVSGLFLPSIFARANTRTLLLTSQVLSALLIAALIALFSFGKLNLEFLYCFAFVQTVLKQLFDLARETHSKSLATSTEQGGFQAQLLSNFYFAQVLGPILSLALIALSPSLLVPLVIDLLSFIFAVSVLVGLRSNVQMSRKIHILRPLGYLRANPSLLRITLLRSVGFWFGMSLFNYLLFTIIAGPLKLQIEHSAWVYSLLGLGAFLSTTVIRKMIERGRLNIDEWKLAMVSHFGMGVCLLLFSMVSSLHAFLLLNIPFGLVMGVNAVSTMVLRRKLATADQFTEVASLELIIGKITDFLVVTLCQYTILNGVAESGTWLLLGSFFFVMNGLGHWRLHPVRGE